MADIENRYDSLYHFMRYLDNFFFKEDIMDLSGPCDERNLDENLWRTIVSDYVSHFDISERMR